MDKMKITSAERSCALGYLEKLAYAHSKTDYDEKYLEFTTGVPGTVVAYYNSKWHHISTEWAKGLKSYHLKNDTTNRVESFFSKLKTFFSPRSSLKDTLSGLFSCIEAMRTERRYKQVRCLNKVKVAFADSPLSGHESKYKEVLTSYAFQMLEAEMKKMGDSHADNYDTSGDQCSCSFFRCMQLPCRHILNHLKQHGFDLFAPNLIANRWTQQHNSILNVVRVCSDVSASMETPQKNRRIMSSNEKFRKASSKLQKVATILAEQGMSSFKEKMAFIDELIHMWSSNKTCTLVETLTLEKDMPLGDTAEILATGDLHIEENVAVIEDMADVQDATHADVQDATHADELPVEDPAPDPVTDGPVMEDMADVQDATHADELPVEDLAQDPVPEGLQINEDELAFDLSSVSLSAQTRRRGRPRGAANRVIGLPKIKKNSKEESGEKKAKKRGRPKLNKNRDEYPTKKHCVTLHLAKVPGSTDWLLK